MKYLCYIEDNKYLKWGIDMIHIAICDVVKRDAEVLEKSTEDFSNERVKTLKKFTVKVWDSLNKKWKTVSTNLVNN